MTTLEAYIVGLILGFWLRPVWDRLWKKLNDKFDEWVDV